MCGQESLSRIETKIDMEELRSTIAPIHTEYLLALYNVHVHQNLIVLEFKTGTEPFMVAMIE